MESGIGEVMAVSHVVPSVLANAMGTSAGQLIVGHAAPLVAHDWQISTNVLHGGTPSGGTARLEPRTEAAKLMARLIRFTVVDPDLDLMEQHPTACVLLAGQRVFAGDDRALGMELALEVSEKLKAHNTFRETVTVENDDGTTRKLRPLRIAQLDVVVESLKAYE
jgi:hypothetical protein